MAGTRKPAKKLCAATPFRRPRAGHETCRRTAIHGPAAAGRPGARARTSRSATWSIGCRMPAYDRGPRAPWTACSLERAGRSGPKRRDRLPFPIHTERCVRTSTGRRARAGRPGRSTDSPRKVMIQANKNGFCSCSTAPTASRFRSWPSCEGELGDRIRHGHRRRCRPRSTRKFVAGEEIEMWPQRGTNGCRPRSTPTPG